MKKSIKNNSKNDRKSALGWLSGYKINSLFFISHHDLTSTTISRFNYVVLITK